MDSYAGLQIGFVKAIAKNDSTISEGDLNEWLSDLHEIEKADECFFTFNRYIFAPKSRVNKYGLDQKQSLRLEKEEVDFGSKTDFQYGVAASLLSAKSGHWQLTLSGPYSD